MWRTFMGWQPPLKRGSYNARIPLRLHYSVAWHLKYLEETGEFDAS